MNMSVTVIYGWLLCCLLLHPSVAKKCESEDTHDFVYYPKYPLSFEDLRQYVIGGGPHSRQYFEVYSFDPADLKINYGLPVLRKVAIQWNIITEGFPGNFTNDYAGWFPYTPFLPDTSGKCETGVIEFETLVRKDMKLRFKFLSVYPSVENFIGTSFSSCPESYLINWYCPEVNIVYGKFGIDRCKSGTRMSIYSSTGPNNMPWQLIVEDLCRNKSPKMDDKRWTMTHDAPEQCDFGNGDHRKKRSTETRHYL
ncbi:uncharacterized protein LOC123540589 [Mercenaria mercenaria]|uniref:uncharacterized protein LOC123540589 n=1 Tax=Mercenaria mercenaria TaxID=6596 RepID=UPI00234F449F|nr:uncharacterized protein LOC123540589 [Mercenaria mercenaria]